MLGAGDKVGLDRAGTPRPWSSFPSWISTSGKRGRREEFWEDEVQDAQARVSAIPYKPLQTIPIFLMAFAAPPSHPASPHPWGEEQQHQRRAIPPELSTCPELPSTCAPELQGQNPHPELVSHGSGGDLSAPGAAQTPRKRSELSALLQQIDGPQDLHVEGNVEELQLLSWGWDEGCLLSRPGY